MIRPANHDDIDIVIKMALESADEMNFTVDIEYAKSCLLQMINDECLVFVYESNGDITGISVSLINCNIFNPKEKEIRNFLWYASKDLSRIGRARVMMALLDFMVWLAKDMNMSLHISLPNTDKMKSGGDLLMSRNLKLFEQYYKLAV